LPLVPEVRAVGDTDREWVRAALLDHWGSTGVARRGELVDPKPLPGFIASFDDEPAGFATYDVRGDECEVVTINAFAEGRGVGRALLEAVRDEARRRRCRRLWLVTTNDNLRALRVYQQWGFRLVALRPGAVDDARSRLKPEIGLVGEHGIPIRDELELEVEL
jgi:GNAT superfamily N-acetyltransferase